MLEQCEFFGASAWRMENEALTAVILPAHGGKAASLRYRPKDWELLFQNPKPSFRRAAWGDDFSDFEACGFDEAFPTVDACTVDRGGEAAVYPDHGELWSAAFSAEPQPDGSLRLRWESPRLGYRYEKRFSLDGGSLVCRYRIENPTDRDLPALWTCHCLVRAEPGLRLLLPEAVRTVRNVFDSALGAAGRLLPYPAAGDLDLSRMPGVDTWKFYAEGPVSEGRCGYDYPASEMRAWLGYDADQLPYLGFWATAGGYRGDVNCALEPSNGFYDSIPLALANGACPVLRAGETWTFGLTITLEET